MKKNLSVLILTAVIFSFNSHLQAQINRGTSLLGGSLSFGSQKNKTQQNQTSENNYSNFGFNPSFGKAVRKNLIVGGDLLYSTHTHEQLHASFESKRTTNSYGVGVFARPYKNLGQSGFYLFLQSRLGFNITDEKLKFSASSQGANTKSNGFEARLNLYPGVAYAVTPKFHIETGLNDLFYLTYSNSKTKNVNGPETVQKSNSFYGGASLGENMQFNVGVKFLFGS